MKDNSTNNYIIILIGRVKRVVNDNITLLFIMIESGNYIS